MGVGVSLSGLASAVANEGGIGIIATAGIGMFEPDYDTRFNIANRRALRNEIQQSRKTTNGIIGVNVMMALTDFEELVQTAIDEEVDFVFIGAGLPLKNPESIASDKLRKVKTKFIPIVSSARAAKIIFQSWARNYNRVPDAIVVEGPLAGGHLGFKREQINDPEYRLEKILTEVITEIKIFEEKFNIRIPVIAAGGIYTGGDILKFMKLGASGVQMATRFVATDECDASMEFKESYIACKEDDLEIIDSPVGLPGRAIKNKYLRDVSAGMEKPFKCQWKCLRTCEYKKVPYCIALALTNAKNGKLREEIEAAAKADKE